ncbi:hypothetical protein SOVF_202970 [Spinacia oleracea]|nr:hypothetical protein SOVF_202970 [Spinacia oleracea]
MLDKWSFTHWCFTQVCVRGAEPKLLAFSSALILTLGVFPICGL